MSARLEYAYRHYAEQARFVREIGIYPEFLSRVEAGEIVLDEVVPDISGPNMFSPLSLVRFHTASR